MGGRRASGRRPRRARPPSSGSRSWFARGAAVERERGGSIVVEALDAQLRITIELGELGAERDTVAAVLNVVLRGPR